MRRERGGVNFPLNCCRLAGDAHSLSVKLDLSQCLWQKGKEMMLDPC